MVKVMVDEANQTEVSSNCWTLLLTEKAEPRLESVTFPADVEKDLPRSSLPRSGLPRSGLPRFECFPARAKSILKFHNSTRSCSVQPRLSTQPDLKQSVPVPSTLGEINIPNCVCVCVCWTLVGSIPSLFPYHILSPLLNPAH